MSKLNYIKGDLFQIVTTSTAKPILAHSCNCFGSWGGGIALQFKQRYPSSYAKYHDFCLTHNPSDIIGKSLILESKDLVIVCLFTSLSGGDSASDIAKYTKLAVQDMVKQYGDQEHLEIHLPKINSGIFGVPWELTELALKEIPLTYNVYVV